MKKHAVIINTSIAITIFALLWWYRKPLTDLLKIIGDQMAVSAYLESFGPIGPIILFVLLVAQVFLAVIPGHALMVTAGYAYGAVGYCVVVASTIIGSQIAFLVSRRYGCVLIYKLASPEIIKRWEKVARHQGIIFFFFAFVLPIFPSDLMCYVAGLSKITSRQFLIANILGRTCCATFITLIGIFGMKPPIWFWVLAAIVILAFFVGWSVYKKVSVMKQRLTVSR